MRSSPLLRNETFLCGGLPTDSNGIVELTTLYPGCYSGRTAHIYAMFHTDYQVNTNGTLESSAGSVIHIGQMFMNESWNNQVFAVSPYNSNTNERTYNDDGSILDEESANGNNAYLE
jgi:protocatechuate 3,4-dioxygenase beta subunit